MSEALYVITHIDLVPPALDEGSRVIEEYAAALRADPGVEDVTLLQQVHRKNHFELLIVFSSEAAYDATLAAPHTRRYRDALHPLIGAPIDDRLHFLVTPAG